MSLLQCALARYQMGHKDFKDNGMRLVADPVIVFAPEKIGINYNVLRIEKLVYSTITWKQT
jgi:hypothetical protein